VAFELVKVKFIEVKDKGTYS